MYLFLAGYKKVDNKHGCCIDNSTLHQRCYCLSPLSRCKTTCDTDINCKGYVTQKSLGPVCNIATTSSCPKDCSLQDSGNVGELVDGATCGKYYGGCFIKQGQSSYTKIHEIV